MLRTPDTKIMKTEEESPSNQDPMNKLRLAAVCLASLMNGFNDAGLGAVLPYMEKDYNIGYAVVSLIFIGEGIGCLFAAIFLDDLCPRFGQANLFIVSNMALILGYIPVMAAAPFPAVPLAFCFIGFGTAINKILGDTLYCHLENTALLPRLLHGCYGFGTIVSPLIATAMVTSEGTLWSRFYLINLGLAVAALAMSLWSLRDYGKNATPSASDLETLKEGLTLGEIPETLCTRTVLFGAIFIMAYRGVEAAISGWTIAFLIDTRRGAPQLFGYVSASFWAGITISRFSASDVYKRMDQSALVYGPTVMAFAFQLLVWLAPDINHNAIGAFAVGTILGHIYPHAAATLMRPMTRRGSSKEMITISAIGSLGGAVVSFLTGLLAQVVDSSVLHPVVLLLLCAMSVCWWGIPNPDEGYRVHS